MSIRRPVLLVLMFSVAACSTPKKSSQQYDSTPKSAQGSNLTEEQKINETYHFFNAVKEKITGNPEKAAELFAQTLRTNPANHAAKYELAGIYSAQRRYNDALFFSKSAAEADPSNEWYQLLLADTYRNLGKPDEALSVYNKLIKAHPERVDYLFESSDILLMQGKINDAIGVYNKVEERIGINRELIIQKQRLYLKQGKITEAAGEIEKLISQDPLNMENYSLLVEMYQVNNLPEKAMATIARMEKIDPTHPSVTLALAEQYRTEGRKQESFEQLKKAFGSPLLGADTKIRILTSYLPLVNENAEMMEQSLTLSKILAETHPQEAGAQAVYGDFLAIASHNKEARDMYRIALELEPRNIQAWQQLLIVESELRDYVAMEAEADSALELFADQSIFYLFSGIAKSQNKKYEEAARRLQAGSKLVVDNDAQLMEFYSNLGEVYNKLGKHEESDKAYEKALLINPDNEYVLNNYAYYLSLRSEKLEKAAEMSKKSNVLSPGNTSFQDTYGWVLYKQGKYNEAAEWLKKAMDGGASSSAVVLEHYGDTL